MVTLSSKKTERLLPTEILYQTKYWAEVKAQVGLKPLAFDIVSSEKWGDVLVLLQSIGRKSTLAYVPQGPEYAPSMENYGPFLEDFSLAFAKHLGPSVAFIRYDLPWRSQYADEIETQKRNAFPEARIREMRMNMNTTSWNMKKAFRDMTVASSLVVDIAKDENDILFGMKGKTRYNIGLAQRKCVNVVQVDKDCLPDFYSLYCQTAARNGFPPCSHRHFAALFKCQIAAQQESEIIFLLAKHNSEILAGAIVSITGKAASFLYGASANTKRNYMAPYAMHWTAMQIARENNCVKYDMGGVSPGLDPDHPFHGLYRFKTGFGGRIDYRCGSWDYPLDQDRYATFSNAEKLQGVQNN